MTPAQQLHQLGISAEAYEGHVLIQTDRTFQMMTPPEIKRFCAHLGKAYREAQRQAGAHAHMPRPEGVPA